MKHFNTFYSKNQFGNVLPLVTNKLRKQKWMDIQYSNLKKTFEERTFLRFLSNKKIIIVVILIMYQLSLAYCFPLFLY